MRITGIIAEYNPLHLGHVHHMEEARRVTGADGIVVVMSGDFVQRGEPALTDKYERTAMALAAGADAVLELPVRFASASAEWFAAGGIEILDRLGCVTEAVCGCEDADAGKCLLAAKILAEEPGPFRAVLRAGLRGGKSFPAAREEALLAAVSSEPSGKYTAEEIADFLRSPNNILAAEYQKAILRRGSRLRLVPVPRSGNGHLSDEISSGTYASAGAVRRGLAAAEQEGLSAAAHTADPRLLTGEELRDALPDLPVWRQLPEPAIRHLPFRIFPDDLSDLLRLAVLRTPEDALTACEDVSPEIAARILRCREEMLSFTELADRIRARSIPLARARRALLHILLGIRKEESRESGSADPISAVRLLGFRKESPVMRAIQDSTGIPVVTKAADAPEESLEEDLRAAEIYRTIVHEKTGRHLPADRLRHPVIL